MKISKLFHWLYGFIMLLPVFFVLGKVVYTSFNPNAKDSYYGNEINSSEVVYFDNVSNIKGEYIYITPFTTSLSSMTGSTNRIDFETLNYNGNTYNDVFILIWKSDVNNSYINISGVASNLNTNGIFLDGLVTFTNITEATYQTFTSQFYRLEYNKYSYLDNSLAYAMSEINEVSIFSWAKDSFLVAPFTYITGLFGVAANSPITTLLSYWLAISIIWLVFDLIMYVPLLVHRWLDKGVLE